MLKDPEQKLSFPITALVSLTVTQMPDPIMKIEKVESRAFIYISFNYQSNSKDVFVDFR